MTVVEYTDFKYEENKKEIVGYSDNQVDEIREHIKQDSIVILKSVFSDTLIDNIKNSVFEYFNNNPQSNPQIDEATPNYHRIDNNPQKSAVKRVAHKFISFYWNNDIANETNLMKAMSRLKNKIAKLPENFTINGIEDGYVTLSNITQYPTGGRRLNKHIDPENIQYTVMIASMSEKDTDFDTGGLYVEENGVKHYLDGALKKGDIFLLKPSLVHGVDDIDSDISDEPKWDSIRGRWILFPALIELKTMYGEKVTGLEDLGN